MPSAPVISVLVLYVTAHLLGLFAVCMKLHQAFISLLICARKAGHEPALIT